PFPLGWPPAALTLTTSRLCLYLFRSPPLRGKTINFCRGFIGLTPVMNSPGYTDCELRGLFEIWSMVKNMILLGISMTIAAGCLGQKLETLRASLQRLSDDFQGKAGIYVRHLVTGEEVALNADTIFPTASMVKIPITVGIFDRIEKGQLAY